MQNTHLNLVQKDTKIYTFTIKNSGVAVDISGWSVYFTVKSNLEDLDADALILKSYVFPTDATSALGIGYLALTSSDTNVDACVAYYDMKFADTGYRNTFVRGKINILPSARIA